MFVLNPILIGLLEIGVSIDCGLIDNARIGFDVPFGVRVDIAIEPSDIQDFVKLYFDDSICWGEASRDGAGQCHDTVGTYAAAAKFMA
jgi:hypothetical protein